MATKSYVVHILEILTRQTLVDNVSVLSTNRFSTSRHHSDLSDKRAAGVVIAKLIQKEPINGSILLHPFDTVVLRVGWFACQVVLGRSVAVLTVVSVSDKDGLVSRARQSQFERGALEDAVRH